MNSVSNDLTFRMEKFNSKFYAMIFLNGPNLSTLINPIIKSVGSDETGYAAQFIKAVSIGNPKAGDVFSNGDNKSKPLPGCTCRLTISKTFQIVNKFLHLILFNYSLAEIPLGSGVKPAEARKLIFAPGRLSGMPLLKTSLISIGTKNPLTGDVKESNTGRARA